VWCRGVWGTRHGGGGWLSSRGYLQRGWPHSSEGGAVSPGGCDGGEASEAVWVGLTRGGGVERRDRDREERELREKLKEEWEAKQAQVLNELLEVTYSYWNGTGHRYVSRRRQERSTMH
jgi:hypothetical protein